MKSVLILASAVLALSSVSSIAQDSIGGAAIPENQASEVADRCRELQTQQGATGTQEPETTITEEQQTANGEEATDGALDLSSITLEQCVEAGLVEGSVDTAN